MKILLLCLSLFLLTGCSSQSAKNQKQLRAGEIKAREDRARKARAKERKKNKVAKKARGVNDDGKGIINKMTGQVVDFEVAMEENPNFHVFDPDVEEEDPISLYAQILITKRAQVSMFGMDAMIKQFRIVEERNPTYKEFMKIMKDYRVRFAKLPVYQTYAYDAKRCDIIILTDPIAQREHYESD